MKKNLFYSLVVLFGAAMFVSCDKDKGNEPTDEAKSFFIVDGKKTTLIRGGYYEQIYRFDILERNIPEDFCYFLFSSDNSHKPLWQNGQVISIKIPNSMIGEEIINPSFNPFISMEFSDGETLFLNNYGGFGSIIIYKLKVNKVSEGVFKIEAECGLYRYDPETDNDIFYSTLKFSWEGALDKHYEAYPIDNGYENIPFE